MSLTLLKDHDPAADWHPDPDRARRLDETVQRRWAQERGGVEVEAARGGRAGGRQRRRARLVLAGAALVAAAVVAILVLPGSETRPGTAPASAAEVLRAARQATPATGSGPWSYTKEAYEMPERFTGRDGRQGIALFSWTTEHWMNDDETERLRSTRDATPRFPTEADRAAWATGAHRPRPWREDGRVTAVEPRAGADTIASVRALPHDPVALEAALRREADRDHVTLVFRVAILLASPAPDPELHAALLAVLERQPDATLERDLRDPLGRVGDGVRFVTPQPGRQDEDWTFVFDRATHRLLGTLTRGADPAGQPTRSWRMLVESTRTASAPPVDADQ
ncbi:hypothetical protein [Baekduia sp. Peel2402]|uniref:hypothetical protein n=1 Tax=Baekduia sp. Peel2402 TaxID=3458296 RepID=UPI00403E5465